MAILMIFILFTGVAIVCIIDRYVEKSGRSGVYENVNDLPRAQAVLVLGARVFPGGRMSDAFSDRVTVAMNVYRAGKADKILVSGDHGRVEYDEVNAAKKYLLDNGIPAKDIFLDHAGFDTYDSVYRAKEIFGVGSMIISTQDFHLPRAVYLARSLGIEACGIKADLRSYALVKFNDWRERGARIKAFADITTKAKPKFLGDKIPINGDGRRSWD